MVSRRCYASPNWSTKGPGQDKPIRNCWFESSWSHKSKGPSHARNCWFVRELVQQVSELTVSKIQAGIQLVPHRRRSSWTYSIDRLLRLAFNQASAGSNPARFTHTQTPLGGPLTLHELLPAEGQCSKGLLRAIEDIGRMLGAPAFIRNHNGGLCPARISLYRAV